LPLNALGRKTIFRKIATTPKNANIAITVIDAILKYLTSAATVELSIDSTSVLSNLDVYTKTAPPP
jgi:hypothetical protein